MPALSKAKKKSVFRVLESKKIPFGYEYHYGNLIHKTAQINWSKVELGYGNTIGPFCVIGGEAQHNFYSSVGKVKIGDDNVFHNSVTVSLPTKMSGLTAIGDRCTFMTSAMIHHDCFIEDDVTMSSNVAAAGNVIIMRGANLGMNSAIHQFKVIGSFSMIGMNACVIKGSIATPGRKLAGVPIRDIGSNTIGLSRSKITKPMLELELERFNLFEKLLENRVD